MSIKRKKLDTGKGRQAGIGGIEAMLAFPDAEEVNLFRLRTKEDYERTFISRPNKSYTLNWGSQQAAPPQPPLAQQIVSDPSYFVLGWRCGVLWSLAMLYVNPGGLFWNYLYAWRFTGSNITPDFNFPLVGGGANQMFNPVAGFDQNLQNDNTTAHPHNQRIWGLTGCPEKQRFLWGISVDNPAYQPAITFTFLLVAQNGATVPANSTTSAPTGRIAIYGHQGGNKELVTNFALTPQTSNIWGWQVSTDHGWYVPEFIITNNPTYTAGGNTYNQLIVQVNYISATGNASASSGYAAGQPAFMFPQVATNIGAACQELSHFEAPDLQNFLPNIRRIRTLTVKGDFACTADSDHNGGQITASMIQPLQPMEPYLLGLAADVAAEEPHVEFLLRNGISAVPKKSGSEWTKLREPVSLNALAAASSSEPILLDQPVIVVVVSAASAGGATAVFDHYCVYEFTTNVTWLFTQFPGMSADSWELAQQAFQAALPTFWWSRKNFAITS
jgi:hypothetical protein